MTTATIIKTERAPAETAGQQPESGGSPGPDDRSTNRDVTLLSLLNAVLRQRYTLLLVVFTAIVIALARSTLAGTTFTSEASFMPGRSSRTISGLAAQVGLRIPMGEDAPSPEFYADLLQTDEILGLAAASHFRREGVTPDTATLLDLYAGDAGAVGQARLIAIRRLRENMVVRVVPRTGVVELKVSAYTPELARDITRRLLELLDEFNRKTRQSRAVAERRFTEGRATELHRELIDAETRMRLFLQQNRQYRGSPELVMQFDGLEREVAMRQELYTSMKQAFEQARIDELRDTPVITVIQTPQLPVRADARGYLGNVLVAVIIGLVLGMVVAILRDHIARAARTQASELAEFTALRSAALRELVQPWRALGSKSRRGPDTAP